MSQSTMPVFHYKLLWLAIGWFLVGFIIWLSLTPAPPQPSFSLPGMDKIAHCFAYLVLMGWFIQLYWQRRQRAWYALSFICMGIAIEFLQANSGYRVLEAQDMLANSSGVLFAWWLATPAKSRYLEKLDFLLIAIKKKYRCSDK